MTSKAVLASLVLLALVLALTNPGEDDFVRWFEGKVDAAAQGQDGLSGLSLLQRTLEVKTSLRRNNYLLFSVFHVHVLQRDRAFVGVFGGFVGLGDAREAVPGP